MSACKKDLIAMVANDTGFTKKDVRIVVDSVFENIAKVLMSGTNLNITGFGKFYTNVVQGRTGRNPYDGKEYTVATNRYPKFTSSKNFRELVKGAGL